MKKLIRQDMDYFFRDVANILPRSSPEKLRLLEILRNTHDWLAILIGDHVPGRTVHTPWTINRETGLPFEINYTKADFPVHAGMKALPAYIAKKVYPEKSLERPMFNLHVPEVPATQDTSPSPTVSEVSALPTSQKARVEQARKTCESKIIANIMAQGQQYSNPHLHPISPAAYVLTPVPSHNLIESGCVDAPRGALGTMREQSKRQHVAAKALYKAREHVNRKSAVSQLSQQRNMLNRTLGPTGRLT